MAVAKKQLLGHEAVVMISLHSVRSLAITVVASVVSPEKVMITVIRALDGSPVSQAHTELNQCVRAADGNRPCARLMAGQQKQLGDSERKSSQKHQEMTKRAASFLCCVLEVKQSHTTNIAGKLREDGLSIMDLWRLLGLGLKRGLEVGDGALQVGFARIL